MTNTGCHADSAATEELFVTNFAGYDYIVGLSGSCVRQVREHLTAVEQTDEVREVKSRTFEVAEFLNGVLKVVEYPWVEFPHRVGIHYNRNSLRGIGLASPSELNKPLYSMPVDLLRKIKGIEFIQPARWDECCGFGGTFCVFEPRVSAKLGYAPRRSVRSPKIGRHMDHLNCACVDGFDWDAARTTPRRGDHGRVPGRPDAAPAIWILSNHGDAADSPSVPRDDLATRCRMGSEQYCRRSTGGSGRLSGPHAISDLARGVSADVSHDVAAVRQLQPLRDFPDSDLRVGRGLRDTHERRPSNQRKRACVEVRARWSSAETADASAKTQYGPEEIRRDPDNEDLIGDSIRPTIIKPSR